MLRADRVQMQVGHPGKPAATRNRGAEYRDELVVGHRGARARKEAALLHGGNILGTRLRVESLSPRPGRAEIFSGAGMGITLGRPRRGGAQRFGEGVGRPRRPAAAKQMAANLLIEPSSVRL